MKIIAHYLPQFHEIEENNKWWGDGFTEWTNTKKAKPIFKNHYQPHTPEKFNYYNLLDKKTFIWQIGLAKKYGVDAFCFYHYWFENEKKLLERPLEMFLKNSELNIEYCISWANETWSRRWDGSENEILIEQKYGDEKDWVSHFNYLLQFFNDKRYIKLENTNKPILIIYKPHLVKEIRKMLDKWNKLAIINGFEGLCFIMQISSGNEQIEKYFDFCMEFEPIFTRSQIMMKPLRSLFRYPTITIEQILNKFYNIFKIRSYKKYSYKLISKHIYNRKTKNKKYLYGAFPNWDNSPRKNKKAIIYHNSTAEYFYNMIKQQIQKSYDEDKPFLFINAWNEWAEGAHLEPDVKNSDLYLQSLKRALKECKK